MSICSWPLKPLRIRKRQTVTVAIDSTVSRDVGLWFSACEFDLAPWRKFAQHPTSFWPRSLWWGARLPLQNCWCERCTSPRSTRNPWVNALLTVWMWLWMRLSMPCWILESPSLAQPWPAESSSTSSASLTCRDRRLSNFWPTASAATWVIAVLRSSSCALIRLRPQDLGKLSELESTLSKVDTQMSWNRFFSSVPSCLFMVVG